ncbi:MAG TPA: cytochrome c [Xanthobacteraceae bacterium]|nr:cytochrome c [Xanthobacteraceae bacterium]
MIRAVFATITIIFGLSVAAAQEDVIKQRKTLMKANGDQGKIGADMIKGDKPFNLAAVHKIFATFQDAAAKMPNLFPENSKPAENSTDDFNASPKVWQNIADLKERFAKFGQDAKAADASVKDLASFKAAFTNIGKNDCGACHELYRLKKG